MYGYFFPAGGASAAAVIDALLEARKGVGAGAVVEACIEFAFTDAEHAREEVVVGDVAILGAVGRVFTWCALTITADDLIAAQWTHGLGDIDTRRGPRVVTAGLVDATHCGLTARVRASSAVVR